MNMQTRIGVSRWPLGLLFCLFVGGVVYAQSGGGFDIRRSTLSSGGGPSIAGQLRIVGTAGQADAGVVAGGSFQLRGGFWAGASAPPGGGEVIFGNGFE
jgi:hypothetical protein